MTPLEQGFFDKLAEFNSKQTTKARRPSLRKTEFIRKNIMSRIPKNVAGAVRPGPRLTTPRFRSPRISPPSSGIRNPNTTSNTRMVANTPWYNKAYSKLKSVNNYLDRNTNG